MSIGRITQKGFIELTEKEVAEAVDEAITLNTIILGKCIDKFINGRDKTEDVLLEVLLNKAELVFSKSAISLYTILKSKLDRKIYDLYNGKEKA